jgi:hypothetical protein
VAGKLHLTLPTGGDLVFCGHHANQLADEILRRAAYILVEDGFDWWGTDRAGR